MSFISLDTNSNSVANQHSQCNGFLYTTQIVNKTFGQWLAENRLRAGLTQGELAKRAGMSPSYVSGLEREEPITADSRPRQPRRPKVERLAKALGADVNEALLVAGYAAEPSETPKPTNLPELIQALSDLGLPVPMLYGGFENLVDDAESFDEAVSRIILDLEMVMKRHRLPPNSNSPRIPEQPIRKRKTG
jgi:transcriptional regulator with XRE-family HTH domain